MRPLMLLLKVYTCIASVKVSGDDPLMLIALHVNLLGLQTCLSKGYGLHVANLVSFFGEIWALRPRT